MAAANRLTGKNLVVLWIDSSGTVNISGDARSLSVTREQETADLTAVGDAYRVNRATVKNFSATLEVLATGSSGASTMNRINIGSEGTILWGEDGTAAGKPKWGYTAIVSNMEQEIPFDDAVTFSVEFMGLGSEVYNGFTSTW